MIELDDAFSYSMDGINIYNVTTGKVTKIFTPGNNATPFTSYDVSPERNYVLISFDFRQVFPCLPDASVVFLFDQLLIYKGLGRYSNFARYSVIDLTSGKVYRLQPVQQSIEHELLQYATWNRRGNGLIYVYKSDIYYRTAPYSLSDARLTNDGQQNVIFNGIPDWVYAGLDSDISFAVLFVYQKPINTFSLKIQKKY